MLTYDEFKARDHFTQEDLLAFAYGRLIKDPPDGFAARLPTPPMLMVDRVVEIEPGRRFGSLRSPLSRALSKFRNSGTVRKAFAELRAAGKAVEALKTL